MSDDPASVPPRGLRPLHAVLLTVAALRYVIPLAALPLAPRLIPDDVGLLTLLRPGKEVLLLAGGLTRTDATPGLVIAFAAYVPLMIFGVWAFFALGRLYAADLAAGQGPGWLHRAIPDERLAAAQSLLSRRGPSVAIIGRLAAMPPTVIGAAAGTSDVSALRYLIADTIGAVISFGIMFGIGLGLGETYEQAGPWITAGTVAVLVPAIWMVSRWVQAEMASGD